MASSFGAVAQTEIYKDVILDGKAARLNIKTGEVTHIDGTIVKSLAAKKIKDSVRASNTVINKNPIPTDSKLTKNSREVLAKNDSANVIYTNRPDTLVNFYKNKEVRVAADTIMTSQTVFVLTNDKKKDTTKTNTTNNKTQSELLKLKESATTMVYEVSEPTSYNDNSSNFHKVLKGETLYTLSKIYNTSLGALKKANNLETTIIKIGQVLRIKNFESYNFGDNLGDWIVSKGDTLYNIAKRNNTTVASIKSINGLTSDLIKIGQTLQLH